ncbi:hypothetical protein P7L78_22770 [Tistrella bauzanensis]|uniref:hypothetical protein n=1 Tax=Tistrella TaxID=171436 RepID=UPI0031F6873E
MQMRIAVESSHDVAGWLARRARADGRVLSPAKLHALLFLALGQFAAAGRGRLMPAMFVVTDMGPRAPDLLRIDAATLAIQPLPPLVERFMDTVWAGLGALELDRLNALIGGLETWRLARDGGLGAEVPLDVLARELRGLSERTRRGMTAAAATEIERRAARGNPPPSIPSPTTPQEAGKSAGSTPPMDAGTSAPAIPTSGTPGRPARWAPARRVSRAEVADRLVGRPGGLPADEPPTSRPETIAAELLAGAGRRAPPPAAGRIRSSGSARADRRRSAAADGDAIADAGGRDDKAALDDRAARALVRALLRDRRRQTGRIRGAGAGKAVAADPWRPERLRHIGRAEAEASRQRKAEGPTIGDALADTMGDLADLTRPRRTTRVFAPRR